MYWCSFKLNRVPLSSHVSFIKCLFANVRYLACNANYIKHVLSENFDMYIFCETWLKQRHCISSLLGDLSLEFFSIRCDRFKKEGGGVAILIRNKFSYESILSECVPNGYELLATDVYTFVSSFRIIVVYRTPSCPSLVTEQLVNTMSDLTACGKSVILIGDFNMPEINWEDTSSISSSQYSSFTDFVKSHEFTQKVNFPTRGLNTLDLLFTNDQDLVSEVSISPPVGNSDHSSISFMINDDIAKPVIVYKRLYSKGDYTKICDYLASVMWMEFFETVDSVNSKYEMFLDIMFHAISMFIPCGKVVENFSDRED